MAKYLKVTSEVVSGTARVFNANGGSYVNFRSRASLSASVIGHGSGRHDGQSAGKDDRLDKGRSERPDRLHLHLVPEILILSLSSLKGRLSQLAGALLTPSVMTAYLTDFASTLSLQLINFGRALS